MHVGAADRQEPFGSIKHTLIALLIAFVLTLTFRGFVMEGFIIPTGSMAPTLLGEHWRVRSPLGGHDWAVNGRIGPRSAGEGIEADDPVSRTPLTLLRADRSAGDRILVLKWAYALTEPARWDAVVFKYPEAPRENFIKRVVGLPGEDVWLADGDVFVREGKGREKGSRDQGIYASSEDPVASRAMAHEPRAHATGSHSAAPAAHESDWRIARKPSRVQRDLWQPVWSSEEAANTGGIASAPPSSGERTSEGTGGTPRDSSPWVGEGWAWVEGGRALRHEGGEGATITWNTRDWPIVDWSPYNDPESPTSRDARRYYPVNDVRVRFAVELPTPGKCRVVIDAQDGRWTAELIRVHDGIAASLIGDGPSRGPYGPTPDIEQGLAFPRALPSGPVQIEVWRFDQSAEVWIDGSLIARGVDHMKARERLARATHREPADLAALLGEDPDAPPIRGNPLADPTLYSPPEISIAFEGGPVTLHRLAVDRDIYYRPGVMEADPRRPSRGSHPAHPASLTADEFFVLGDNSGASRDSRMWDAVDPWVARSIDARPGVVPRSLLVGKAFFVYFPAAHEVSIAGRDRPLIPDFGRMRWIR